MLIDGSYGEGGGQILRTSIALSAILGEDVEIINIRAKRRNPGLAAQHLWGIKLAGMMSNAKVSGLKVGSQRVVFSPNKIKGGEYRIDIGTAGSITLLLQTAIPIAIFADGRVILKITGGTDVSWSPPIDYYRYVLSYFLRRMGVKIDIEVIERGYYPEGGGKVKVEIEPAGLEGLSILKRCEMLGKMAYINMRGLPIHVVKRMSKVLREYKLFEDVGDEGRSKGCGLVILEEYSNTILAGDSLCKRGVPAEKVARIAVEKMEKERNSNSTVDVNMGDHLITFGSLAKGTTVYYVREVTEHIKTNAWVVQKFGKRVKVEKNKIEIQA
ncbi:RNA 3'-terminal phosphate cyclase [Candidatus Aciduliprofundum boonei]|uniref:RNA 3'-terminal phosphate cyclase n=1 Tax=Aciduliprofundum boonei (strain DSM 19572 / T469) TaxID=439481 RepID=B5I9D3_ACIB4|nr:RNA 3'-terminal phosphate cyclase [Candidatus Aciduliprofundum boonei]ADD08598.1 RNA 3'-phosphate cyclase [Aciduliprofundum boonei T469]EDY36926.1 RNA 3'-terminal phosphate cyclase [Aciduliprofundum boonei T469]HII55633.1 RNA 3'-terminal phosphate cyclase [Candidatus Aciduliprofundum boonei]